VTDVRKPRGALSRFVRPQLPRNLTDEQRSEERSSTWLELFFDLCFVVAVAAVARGLHDDPSFAGVLRFAGLLIPVWWSWMIFTWHATSFDNDDVPYRAALLAAMLSMLGMAAAIDGGAGSAEDTPGASTAFVLTYAAMRLLLAGLWIRAWRASPASIKPFSAWYTAGNLAGAGVWLLSLAVPEPARYGVWALGILVELLGPILAVRTLGNARISFHPRHIPERYGLFTIIVLGESVLAVAAGTAGTAWAPAAVLTAVFGFVIAAGVWWIYFDNVGSEALYEPTTAFVWGYGHFFVYAGIAVFGVGVQLAIEGASATASAAAGNLAAAAGAGGGEAGLGAGYLLGGGVALYLLAIGLIDRVNRGAGRSPVVPARLAAATLVVGLAIVGAAFPPVLFAGLVALVLLVLAAFETIQDHSPPEPGQG